MKKKIVKIVCVLLCFLFVGVFLFGYEREEDNTEVEQIPAVSTKTFQEKIGGFMKGVCHPNGDFGTIVEANIEWVRFDLKSLPYDENGTLTQSYLNFKAKAQSYVDNGFKVLAVTPYPQKYIDAGYDPREEENEEKIIEIARFLAIDLQGIVSAFQITNEMGIEHFTLPLTLEEAARFIGIQLKAMYPVRGEIIIGYNYGGMTYITLTPLMKSWWKYCDYVGADIYLGCFDSFFKSIDGYDGILDIIHKFTGLPVIMTEFGYIGNGDIKTDEQKQAILQKYGVDSEEEAREDIFAFIDRLPEAFRDHLLGLEYSSPGELANKLFNTELANHLYCEIQGGYQLTDYRHTWEDQGRFFTDVLERIKSLDYVYGAFVYCFCDSDACYICGQKDCPVETGWGLLDCDGNLKPAYYAVQAQFAVM